MIRPSTRKGRGTRSSADCCATSDQRPSLPPFAARLCQSKSATDLRTPSPRLKEKRSRSAVGCSARSRLLYNRQLTMLVYPPPPPRAINARETHYQCDRQCLESAYINIIPSGLCNSSLDRHLSARTTSICEGQWPATTVLQAVG